MYLVFCTAILHGTNVWLVLSAEEVYADKNLSVAVFTEKDGQVFMSEEPIDSLVNIQMET